ncbi:hypothetical protein D3C85_1296080 [compost metagenome]
MKPGQMALLRMLRSRYSTEMARANMWQAPLVVQYRTSMGVPTTPEIDEVQITLPPPASIIFGSTARVTRNMLLTLMFISRSQSLSLVSRKGAA